MHRTASAAAVLHSIAGTAQCVRTSHVDAANYTIRNTAAAAVAFVHVL